MPISFILSPSKSNVGSLWEKVSIISQGKSAHIGQAVTSFSRAHFLMLQSGLPQFPSRQLLAALVSARPLRNFQKGLNPSIHAPNSSHSPAFIVSNNTAALSGRRHLVPQLGQYIPQYATSTSFSIISPSLSGITRLTPDQHRVK
jgi:hypothetical protein